LDFVVDGRHLRLLVPSKHGSKTADEAVPTVAPRPDPLPPVDLVEPVFIDPLPPAPVAEAPPVLADPPVDVVETPPVLAEPPAPALAERPVDVVETPPVLAGPPAPVLIEPPAPVLIEPPVDVVETPPVLAEPPAAVLIEPPAPEVVEPPVDVLETPSVLAEPPAPLLAEPPAAVVIEPPVDVVETPPMFTEPQVPVVTEPPAPVSLIPPAPVLLEPPSPVPPVVAETLETAEPLETVEPLETAEPPVYVSGADDTFVTEATDGWTDDEYGTAPARPPAWFRYASSRPRAPKKHARPRTRHVVRAAVFTVLAGLIPIAAGVRYFQTHNTTGRITGVALSDTAIAGRIGIQPGDLVGWSATAPRMGNAFAAGATTNGPAALGTAVQASTVLARCLHVPVSAVDGAFGMGNSISQRTAEVASPSYADPAGNGGAVNSVVDMVQSPQVGAADASVFQNPALFATCYQPFVQAMLPYATGGGGTGFATATVQPVVVPVPNGPGTVTVAAFQIARIANDPGQTKTVVTTATAVFVGRVQATLGTVSDLVFSINAQNALVRDLEIRSLGVGEL
jgi:hypothetical protein